MGALDLGYTAGVDSLKANPPKLLVMLQADEGKITRDVIGDECSVIYIGSNNVSTEDRTHILIPIIFSL